MEITEVRVKLVHKSEDRLIGFCSVTFDDCFVVRDLRIVNGKDGPFVAMPSRRLTSNCPGCQNKNHLRALFCDSCGKKLAIASVVHGSDGREKMYADIAHPVNASCREMIQNCVVVELNRELKQASRPGYKPRFAADSGDTSVESDIEPDSEAQD